MCVPGVAHLSVLCSPATKFTKLAACVSFNVCVPLSCLRGLRVSTCVVYSRVSLRCVSSFTTGKLEDTFKIVMSGNDCHLF